MKILIPVDGSAHARLAVKRGGEIAKQFGAEVTIINVVALEFYQKYKVMNGAKRPIDEFVGDARVLAREEGKELEKLKIKPEIHGAVGDPAEEIVKLAEEGKFDLIVMGFRGLTGIKRYLLGSVSRKVVDHASCSVMIVKK